MSGGTAGMLEPYVAGLREGRIIIPRCTACAHWDWYPHRLCAHCTSESRDWITVSGLGVVHTWTQVERIVVPVLGLSAPYIVALIELADAPGVRIPARSRDLSRPEIGSAVRLRPIPTPAGPTTEYCSVNVDVDELPRLP